MRTKIVATLGPATDSPAVLRKMIRAGLSVARFNFSHGSHENHEQRIGAVRRVAAEEGAFVAVLVDLQGPRVRLGEVLAGTEVADGATFILDGRRTPGDADGVSVDHARRIAAALRPGDRVLIDDGKVACIVRRTAPSRIETEVLTGGPLGSHKGVNFPDTPAVLPALTPKDRADVRFGLAHGVDYFALSFVGAASQVLSLRRLIRRLGGSTPLIAKIERRAALDDLDAILLVADGVMVARGDLALDIGPENVPVAQKAIIRAANAAAIPVITATQMLESMIHAPTPTRAEASDVANTIWDGSDAVMLSGETAIGEYPAEAVQVMAAVARASEPELAYRRLGRRPDAAAGPATITRAISGAAVAIARDLEADVVVAVTSSGQTARAVAHHRPEVCLIGATRNPETARRLALVWGVTPLVVKDYQSTDQMIHVVMEAVAAAGYAGHGDLAVITSGQPIGRPGSTNMVQVRRFGEAG